MQQEGVRGYAVGPLKAHWPPSTPDTKIQIRCETHCSLLKIPIHHQVIPDIGEGCSAPVHTSGIGRNDRG